MEPFNGSTGSDEVSADRDTAERIVEFSDYQFYEKEGALMRTPIDDEGEQPFAAQVYFTDRWAPYTRTPIQLTGDKITPERAERLARSIAEHRGKDDGEPVGIYAPMVPPPGLGASFTTEEYRAAWDRHQSG